MPCTVAALVFVALSGLPAAAALPDLGCVDDPATSLFCVHLHGEGDCLPSGKGEGAEQRWFVSVGSSDVAEVYVFNGCSGDDFYEYHNTLQAGVRDDEGTLVGLDWWDGQSEPAGYQCQFDLYVLREHWGGVWGCRLGPAPPLLWTYLP